MSHTEEYHMYKKNKENKAWETRTKIHDKQELCKPIVRNVYSFLIKVISDKSSNCIPPNKTLYKSCVAKLYVREFSSRKI